MTGAQIPLNDFVRPDFYDVARCRPLPGVPDLTDLFYNESRKAEAVEFCSTCPVVAECKEHAIVSSEDEGVWGATLRRPRMSERQNRGIRKPAVNRARCGTTGGYQRHLRLKEDPCFGCSDANRIRVMP